jgi:hypothetical protein
VLGERKTGMPKFLVTVSREVEVDCNDEAIAVQAALRVVESGSSKITGVSSALNNYVAKVSGDPLVTGIRRHG